MNYEPGTVAVATVRGVPNVRVFLAASNMWVSGTRVEGSDLHRVNHEVTDVRPLVVLDLPNGAKAGWPVLIDALRKARQSTGYTMTFDGLLDQIEQQTKPPKPEEPKGLGAVVIDSRGVRWVRTESAKGSVDPWQAALHVAEPDRVRSLPYADIDAVRVLSEGVVND